MEFRKSVLSIAVSLALLGGAPMVGASTVPEGTTPPASTLPPPGGTTPPPPIGGTTPPPTGGSTPPPTGGTTLPPPDGTTLPPIGSTTPPPTGGSTPPPTGGTTSPPPDGTTLPPIGSTTPPPTGGGTAGGFTPPPPPTGYLDDPDSGLWLDPAGNLVDPDTGYKIDPQTGNLIKPDTGEILDPLTGWPIDPATGFARNPETGRLVEPVTGLELDPNTRTWFDPDTAQTLDMRGMDLAGLMFQRLLAAGSDDLDMRDLYKAEIFIEDYFPGWDIDPITGEILPPPGEDLWLPEETLPSDFPTGIGMPKLPDFDKGCAMGGNTRGGSLLDEVNQAFTAAGLSCTISQSEEGLLHVTCGTAEFAMMPGEAQQAPDDAQPGLSFDPDTGNPVIITQKKRMLVFYTAPWDMSDLQATLGDAYQLALDEYGVLRIQENTVRGGTGGDYGTPGGNVRGPRRGTRAGFRQSSDTQGEIQYADGRTQDFYASVPKPGEFMNAAKLFPGVEDISYTQEGWFKLRYNGALLRLQPVFGADSRRALAGETFTAKIVPGRETDGSLNLRYSVQDGEEILTVKLLVQSM